MLVAIINIARQSRAVRQSQDALRMAETNLDRAQLASVVAGASYEASIADRDDQMQVEARRGAKKSRRGSSSTKKLSNISEIARSICSSKRSKSEKF